MESNPGGEARPEDRPQRRREWSGVWRSIVLPLGILGIIVGGLWYWDERGSGDGGAYDDAYGVVQLPDVKNATDDQPLPEIGRAAPDFVLEKPSGGTLRLSDLQGGPVLINFWATWCPPCRSEMPELVEAFEQHRAEGLVIVGVNLQEADDRVNGFADDFGVDFPLVVDRDSEVADAWRLGGPFEGLPSSFFIDERGVIQERFFGQLNDDFLQERLASILPEAAG